MPPPAFRLLVPYVAAIACTAAVAQRAEVVHWWTSGGESAAVAELASAYRHAGGTWVDVAVAGGDNARAAALNDILGGKPPTAAQFNASKQYLDLIGAGLLNDIDAVAVQGRWESWMPRPLIDSIKVNGHYYAAPVDVHNPAWFWYSKAALRKAHVDREPATIDEFFAALDRLAAAGLVPLAIGGQAWQEFVTFYAVLLQVGGKDTYLAFFRDHSAASVDTPGFRRSLATLRRLRGYVSPGTPGRNWNDATALLIAGKAGFQIMGDWAKGEFASVGQIDGKDYGCFVGFGADPPYLVASDVLVFPKSNDKTAVDAQRKLAAVATAPATQVAFNLAKGSVPIRTDIDTRRFDACAQTGLRALAEPARLLPNPDMLMSPDMIGAVQDAIAKFWNTSEPIDDAVRALQHALQD